MPLTPKTKQALKAKAHALKPIIFVGQQGLTANVQNEIDRALNDHELIKIRIQTTDRDLKREIFSEICLINKADPVQLIGNMATLFRKNPEK